MQTSLTRFMLTLIAVLAVAGVPAGRPAHAATGPRCYVNVNAPGPTHDGDSWPTAYTHAYDATQDGYCEEIWVAQGFYTPNPGFGTQPLYLNHEVEMYGGFAGGETTIDQRDWKNHVTILSGDVDGNDTNTDGNNIDETPDDIHGANSTAVVQLNGSAAHPVLVTTVLDGFTITGGSASLKGGGILCPGNGAGNECSPTLANLTIIGNKADGQEGGGVYLDALNGGVSSPRIRNVIFRNNRSRFGGALNLNASSGTTNPEMTDVTFEGNTAEWYGGAIYAFGWGGTANYTITRGTFSSNSAGLSGGAILNTANTGTINPVLSNVTFSGNTATDVGGGAMDNSATTGTCSPSLYHVTFYGNTVTDVDGAGGAMHNAATDTGGVSHPELVNSILWGNSAAVGPQVYNATTSASLLVGYTVIENGCGVITRADCATIGHNMSTPALLVGLADNGGLVKTMRLSAGSSAINTADDTVCLYSPVAAKDARGVARPQGEFCDLGAYEYTHFFSDMPVATKEWMEPWVDLFYLKGITAGCGQNPLVFCPENQVTRAEMAVFLLRAKHGQGYTPPPLSHFFNDVPVATKEWMEPWIDEFYREGMTTGCGQNPPVFCPENQVTRAEMAVFVLRSTHASGWQPPSATGIFSDVPVPTKEWMQPWIEEYYHEGVTTGCGVSPLRYCPENQTTRAEMAVFIGRAYRLR